LIPIKNALAAFASHRGFGCGRLIDTLIDQIQFRGRRERRCSQ
jgi:hypothetical protein